MTLIVGLIEKGKVIIGGDSAGVKGYDIVQRKDVKVFRNGDFIIGCTSSFRMMQLIRFKFKPPRRFDDVDIFEYMCTLFIDELRKTFRDGGYMEVENQVERGGVFIVGYKNRLFKIEGDYQVGETTDGFYCAGCGEDYALGALCALGNDLSGEEKVLKALEIGANRSAGVIAPFILETT